MDLDIITSPLSLVCKSCRKLFQKDLHIFGDDDLTCPHCSNRYVIPGMTPESVLISECTAAIGEMMEHTLKQSLKLDIDMALNFEHLVDYSLLPESLDPNYESKLDHLLHMPLKSREATPMLMNHDDMSRPHTATSIAIKPNQKGDP